VEAYQPDMLIAGPAFNAGRFGIACADACTYVKEKLNIESITGLNEENPAVEMYRKHIYILKAGKSAASMTKDAKVMADFANKLLAGETIGLPKEEGYYAKGRRVNRFSDKNGAVRAVDMLLAKIKGEPFETELEISMYDKVKPAAPRQGFEARQSGAAYFGRHCSQGQSRSYSRRNGEGMGQVRFKRHAGAGAGEMGIRSCRLRPGLCQPGPQQGGTLQHDENS
jgi:hypothetical protein